MSEPISDERWLLDQALLVVVLAAGTYGVLWFQNYRQTQAALPPPTPLPTPVLAPVSDCKTIMVDQLKIGTHLNSYEFDYVPIIGKGNAPGIKPNQMKSITINYSPNGISEPNGTQITISPETLTQEALDERLGEKLELNDQVCVTYLARVETPSITPTPNPNEGGKGYLPNSTN